MEGPFEAAIHGLRDLPNKVDIRNMGLVAGIELMPLPDKPTQRAVQIFQRCFDEGLLIRTTGDTIALSPPLIIEQGHIDRIAETLRKVITAVAA